MGSACAGGARGVGTYDGAGIEIVVFCCMEQFDDPFEELDEFNRIEFRDELKRIAF